jgi:SAM-dependent methyltransferase
VKREALRLHANNMNSKYIHDTIVHHSKDAEHIVPFIIKLFNPSSVLDVGCGLGNFLKIFIDSGINDVNGIEGEWLDTSKLVIDKNVVYIKDLEKPFHLKRKFDIALCLEVAEHISENAAEQFIQSLTDHSDVIIFSAAIPEQGGQNHINEQWIDYWDSLFNKRGYKLYDIIRPFIWNIHDIYWWYRQNIVVCINSSKKVNFKSAPVNNYIHPELYLSKIAEINALREAIAGHNPTNNH